MARNRVRPAPERTWATGGTPSSILPCPRRTQKPPWSGLTNSRKWIKLEYLQCRMNRRGENESSKDFLPDGDPDRHFGRLGERYRREERRNARLCCGHGHEFCQLLVQRPDRAFH